MEKEYVYIHDFVRLYDDFLLSSFREWNGLFCVSIVAVDTQQSLQQPEKWLVGT